jgi:hypothetical protein
MGKPVTIILIILVGVPLAIAATIIAHPFWRWFELSTGIESFGHSGPAGWCYIFDYALFVLMAGFMFFRKGSRRSIERTNKPSNATL